MNELDVIQNELKEIEYTNFPSYVSQVLTAFKIPQATIKKILSRHKSDVENFAVDIYKRATIIHNSSIRSWRDFNNLTLDSTNRLTVIINENYIFCKDRISEETIQFTPKEIWQHALFFTPLIYGLNRDKDIESTVDFAELIGGLFNQLSLDELNIQEKKSNKIADFIFTLVYISFAKSITKDVEIEKTIKLFLSSQSNNYSSFTHGLIEAVLKGKKQNLIYQACPIWNICNDITYPVLNINKQCFELASKVLTFDLKNVDIEVLGSLTYKFVSSEEKASIYGHQTSNNNVLKVITPLFVAKYESLIKENRRNAEKLSLLSDELLTKTFFDPTNGPGCFLTSALNSVIYLRALINEFSNTPYSGRIPVNHFIALVENDISYRLSHLSLWVTYLQHLEKENVFDESTLLLTYNEIQIKRGSQLSTNWSTIVPNDGNVYILGSPTFKGSKKLTAEDKRQMKTVYGTSKLDDSDFSSCWLYLGANYIKNSTSECAFVLTNSICQGVQVSFIWNKIYSLGCEISFAYRSFKWKNNSSQSSGVSVVIIGIANNNYRADKWLFTEDRNNVIKTSMIGPYLINDTKTIVKKSTEPKSGHLPKMPKGNMPYDGEYLLLTKEEKISLLERYPQASKFLKRIVGSEEFINRKERWCLWIDDNDIDEALAIQPIAERVENVKACRLAKSDEGARKLANRPHQFREFRSTKTQSLVIPSVSSESRIYIPIGFIGSETIISNLAFAIYDCEPWIMGVITSKMHMVWIRTVCGSLETRIRYSNQLGYNTFPFPSISTERKAQITRLIFDIINEREKYCDLTLGELYSNLPGSLVILHKYLDDLIDSCYRPELFVSDIERIRLLFNLYDTSIK